MKQVITRQSAFAGYGGTTQYLNVSGNHYVWSDSITFGVDSAKHPVSVPGTFKNLTVRVTDAHDDLVLTLFKNGSATALTVSLASGATLVSDTTHTVSIVETDDICFQLVGTQVVYPGYHIGICIEFDSSVTGQSFYGMNPYSGGVTAGDGFIGGAFGNGLFQFLGLTFPANSNTYSIASLIGNITRLDLKTYAGAPGSGVWTGYIRKNSILQDGSGGTVDTRCILTSSTIQNHSTFTLPIAVTDHVDIVVIRTVIDAPYALAQVAASIAFTSTIDELFMICGGNNDAIDTTNPGWRWIGTAQLATPESNNEAPIGPTTVTPTGLYVEYAGPPGNGRDFLSTLRKNESDTIIAVTVADLDTTGSIVANETYILGDTIDIQLVPTNSPGTGGFHWGLALSIVSGPPPTSKTGGIYYIKINKTNDTIYNYIYGGTGSSGPTTTTSVVAIPNPLVVL